SQCRTSASVGLGWRSANSTELMSMPGVQKPHCRPWFSWRGKLHRVQRIGLTEALDRGDARAIDGGGKQRAALHRAIIDMHHTGAALTGVAADMGAGQRQLLAQQIAQQHRRFDIDAGRLTVENEADIHVFLSSCQRSTRATPIGQVASTMSPIPN